MIKRIQRTVGIGLLIAISAISFASCTSHKFILPEYELEPISELRASAPNCLSAIETFRYSFPKEENCDKECLLRIEQTGQDALKCREDDAYYWENRYFEIRAMIEPTKGIKIEGSGE